jgi:hypothetical protein
LPIGLKKTKKNLKIFGVSAEILTTRLLYARYECYPLSQLKRLVAGFPPRRPKLASGQHVRFVVDKEALGQVFSEYFGFPCQKFHQILHHHNHLGLAQ